MDPDGRTEGEIAKSKEAKGSPWAQVRWIRRRRPVLTAIIVAAATVHTLVSDAVPYDLLRPGTSVRYVGAWFLIFFGIGVRLWGSVNLRKNQEITETGVYRLVRHPLYLGSLSFFLAYFVTVGDIRIGLILFAVLVFAVYYPTMLAEEEHLNLTFPAQRSGYRPPPRLVPDLRRFREAMATDRFDLAAARRNLGFRGLWFLLGLPLYLRFLGWLQRTVL